ncbi:hypothetical protein A2U01_0083732, partial [Trifolium medium]|nr:hypothetical protein [Trifolium medium]
SKQLHAVDRTQRDTPPDHLCQEDFRYKESVIPFVETSSLIPLLGHEEATGGSSTLGLEQRYK